MRKLKKKICDRIARLNCLIAERKGDLATNTIGAIIISVVMVGILVLAIKSFFPTFFADMFDLMKEKLNANW